jgi:hypothetical protein
MTRKPQHTHVGVHTPDEDLSNSGLSPRPATPVSAFHQAAQLAGNGAEQPHLPEDGIYTPEIGSGAIASIPAVPSAADLFKMAGDSTRAQMCTGGRPADDGASETIDAAAVAAGFYDNFPHMTPIVRAAAASGVALPPSKGVFPPVTLVSGAPNEPDTFDI